MHVTFTEQELAFQEEVRAFFRDELPEDIREAMESGFELEPEMQIRWQKILFDRGWAGVNWPVEYGGTGWTPVQKYIFAREEGFANAPVVIPFGLRMVGPVIYTFGSDAQ
ncbi:MAG: acyl-CoA dehydrogenase family protein, partial [Gammaproteobacteria bacterium]|nr:acyl-CoA dehydrogenase family protein [Gammaproteobacteria bacterium]